MICTQCMSQTYEAGWDIGMTDNDQTYEETQFECPRCGTFGSIVIIGMFRVEYVNLWEKEDEPNLIKLNALFEELLK